MTYYLLQAILVPAWWAAISLSPRIYSAFHYTGISQSQFSLFITSDLVVISGLSLIAWRRPTATLRAILIGAFAYATVWCMATSWSTRSGYLGTALMGMGLLANIFALTGSKCFFRKSHSSKSKNVIETTIQSTIIWVIFLFVIPYLILKSFDKFPTDIDSNFLYPGTIMFIAFSTLGIFSARSLVNAGHGTPLPLNAPKRLVTTGPYKYVRNPMAIAGLGQGLAISIITRSVEVAFYCILGMIVWNYLVRPIEEEDLRQTFGEEFQMYASRVKCWIPRTERI